jgi:hypothetical protein
MFPEHPRACIPHYRLYLFAAVSLVTVNRTFRARRFILTKTAAIKPQVHILHQFLAFET